MGSFSAYCQVVERNAAALQEIAPDVEKGIALSLVALSKGNKIMFCGNGGSAADAQHLAAELMGRFLVDRAPLAALALTVDTSALTAIGNDYGFNDIFSRQLRGIGVAGDVLVAISTSGNSRNIVAALKTAKQSGIGTIGLLGHSGGMMRDLCDIAICVPSDQTNHIQEMHIVIAHALVRGIEEALAP